MADIVLTNNNGEAEIHSGVDAVGFATPEGGTVLFSEGEGSISREELEQAIAEYLGENPQKESDPTVPDWAKAEEKPKYTAEEVGAQPAGNYATKDTIPTKTSQLENDSGFITVAVATLLNYYLKSETYKKSETYSATEVDNLVNGLSARLDAFFDTDDTTLDELSEIVAYIKSNKSLIDSITTSKVSVSDIINNLTTSVANKPLSAAQGVALKTLIDTLSENKLDASSLTGAIDTALAQAKASGEFDGENGKSAYQYAQDSGFIGTEEEFAEKLASDIGYFAPTVMDYGAKGDGATDDTAAFQTALAENRVVFVPGGTYKLSGELEIGHHCELELSADTVLNFTQTTGNCITLKYLSSLKGNHAVIEVPYAFTGNVINLNDYDVSADEYKKDVPPWRHYSPQHKSGRFITDINIGKVDGYGIHRSVDGWTGGTAVYLTTDDQYDSHCVWAAHFYNVRIAGAFSYGIRAVNFGAGWNHDMRIETTIEACEVGVSLENCHCAFVDAIIQPVPAVDSADNKTPYAKHGIKLVSCKAIDLSRSRVWDWNANCSLVTAGGEYQHIALYGDCTGLVMSDYLYYWASADIRDLIYTDTPSNLEKMTILQEPFTRWFKPVDSEPYFFDGLTNKRLAMKSDFDEYFQTDSIANFTDALATAIDTDGSIYNGIGYDKFGGTVTTGGSIPSDSIGDYGHTGFIPCKAGDTLYFKNFDFQLVMSLKDGWCKANLFNANFEHIGQNDIDAIISGSATYYFSGGSVTDDGGTLVVNSQQTDVAYARFGFRDEMFGTDPVISVNNEIKLTQAGFLADSIKVKGENVVLTSPGGKSYLLAVSDDGTLSATATSV